MIHQLKQASVYFKDVISGKKPFEVRKNDRNFKVGDYLALNELDTDGKETGRSALFRCTYVLNNPEYCKEGYVILGIKPCTVMESDFGSQTLDNKSPEEKFAEAINKIKNLGAALNETQKKKK